jgi:ATP-binding cassette subfamily C protein CydC
LITLFLSAFSPLLSLLLACFYLAAGLGLPLLAGLASRAPGEQLIAVRSRLVVAIVEATRGMNDLQVFNAQTRQLGKIDTLNKAFAALQQRLTTISSVQSAGMTLLSQAAAWGVLVLAIPLVSNGQISGVVLASLVLATLASFEAVAPLPVAAQTLSSSLAAARRLFAVIDAPSEVVDPSDPLPLPATQIEIQGGNLPSDLEVRHLSYCYPEKTLSLFLIIH